MTRTRAMTRIVHCWTKFHIFRYLHVSADAPVTAVDRDRVETLVGSSVQRDHKRPNRSHRFVASEHDVAKAAKEALMEMLLTLWSLQEAMVD